MIFALVEFFLGIAGIFFLSNKITNLALSVASISGLSRGFVGMILLSGGTSLPELFATSIGSLKGFPNLAVGNICGSNLTNILFFSFLNVYAQGKLLQSSNLFSNNSIVLTNNISLISLISLFFFILSPTISSVTSNSLSYMFPPTILGLYLIGLYCLFLTEKQDNMLLQKENNTQNITKINIFKLTWQFLLYFSMLFVCSYLLTNASQSFSEISINGKVLGKTFAGSLFLSVSTSFPEFAISFSAIRIGALDMSLGNMLGSNFFNVSIFFWAGLCFPLGRFLGLHDISSNFLRNLHFNHIYACLMSVIILFVMMAFPLHSRSSNFKLQYLTLTCIITSMYCGIFFLLYINR